MRLFFSEGLPFSIVLGGEDRIDAIGDGRPKFDDKIRSARQEQPTHKKNRPQKPNRGDEPMVGQSGPQEVDQRAARASTCRRRYRRLHLPPGLSQPLVDQFLERRRGGSAHCPAGV